MPLNPSASVFEPSAPINIKFLPEDPWESITDLALSPEDASEIEAVEAWVALMADFEESESDHLIELALRYADQNLKQRAVKSPALIR